MVESLDEMPPGEAAVADAIFVRTFHLGEGHAGEILKLDEHGLAFVKLAEFRERLVELMIWADWRLRRRPWRNH